MNDSSERKGQKGTGEPGLSILVQALQRCLLIPLVDPSKPERCGGALVIIDEKTTSAKNKKIPVVVLLRIMSTMHILVNTSLGL